MIAWMVCFISGYDSCRLLCEWIGIISSVALVLVLNHQLQPVQELRERLTHKV